jgi:predicted oxidoreductase
LQSRLEEPLVANQVEISLLRTEAMFDGTLDHAQIRRTVPQAWSPLGGGRLSREPSHSPLGQVLNCLARERAATPEQLAIAWLLRHPAGIHPIIGSGKLAHIRRLVEAEHLDLDRQAWFELLAGALGREVA